MLQLGCHEHPVQPRPRIHTDTCSGTVVCADRPCSSCIVACGLATGSHRSQLQDLIGFVDGFNDDDVQFTLLTEQMDTAAYRIQLIFQHFGALHREAKV